MSTQCTQTILDALHNIPAVPGRDAFPAAVTGTPRNETWIERHPDENGVMRDISVAGEIWTECIQAALDRDNCAYLPYRDAPYYIDAPIVLRSGYRLIADPDTEIRLKPGCNRCMVRNEHLIDGHVGPVQPDESSDSDILIVGGIWTTLATTEQESNGNVNGWATSGGFFHAHGVILLSNVTRFVVRDVTIRQCRPHGIQISNASHFLVENIRFDRHHRDGVHINGPASFGCVRKIRVIRGIMGDDLIALNAWDWHQTVVSFGPIHHILVEDVQGCAESAPHAPSEIRLLGGTKHFKNGATVACDIYDCVIRDIEGIRTFKMYDQPNLEYGVDKDFADPIGEFHRLYFENIRLAHESPEAVFPIASNIRDITIRNVTLDFEPASTYSLVQVGPMSMTYKFQPDDPSTWVEVFSPDKNCIVRNLQLDAIRSPSRQLPGKERIRVVKQHINPDYPNTTPRGGRGEGILL